MYNTSPTAISCLVRQKLPPTGYMNPKSKFIQIFSRTPYLTKYFYNT